MTSCEEWRRDSHRSLLASERANEHPGEPPRAVNGHTPLKHQMSPPTEIRLPTIELIHGKDLFCVDVSVVIQAETIDNRIRTAAVCSVRSTTPFCPVPPSIRKSSSEW
jgi:hypothetical protein